MSLTGRERKIIASLALREAETTQQGTAAKVVLSLKALYAYFSASFAHRVTESERKRVREWRERGRERGKERDGGGDGSERGRERKEREGKRERWKAGCSPKGGGRVCS